MPGVRLGRAIEFRLSIIHHRAVFAAQFDGQFRVCLRAPGIRGNLRKYGGCACRSRSGGGRFHGCDRGGLGGGPEPTWGRPGAGVRADECGRRPAGPLRPPGARRRRRQGRAGRPQGRSRLGAPRPRRRPPGAPPAPRRRRVGRGGRRDPDRPDRPGCCTSCFERAADLVYPRAQPDHGGPPLAGGRRRLRTGRSGAPFRCRYSLPASLQADRPERADHRVSALHDVGYGPCRRPCNAVGLRLPETGPRGHDDPHLGARIAPCVRRPGALRRLPPALPHRAGSRHRSRVRGRQAARARRPPPARRRFALPARAQREGRQGGPARPPRAVLDRQVPVPRRTLRRSRRARRAEPARACPLRAGGGPALARPRSPPHRLRPRGGPPHLPTCSPRSRPAWATGRAAATWPSSAS